MASTRSEFEIEEETKGKLAITPLPQAKCWALYLANLTDSICFTFLFPFLPYLVEFQLRDYLSTIPTDQHDRYISIFSGILGSCYSIAQFFSSICIGYICDRYGKRPVLIFGTLCNAIGTLSFAFISSYPMAILIRLFSGFTNANAVASRSLLADFTDKTNRTQAFTYLNVFAIVGSIIGPFLGGMLAEPHKRFPGVFAGVEFFEDFPFSLPCFATLGISLFGLFLAAFYVFDEPAKSENPLLPRENKPHSFCETLRILKGNSSYLTVGFAWCITGLTLAMTTELTALWAKSAVDHGGLGWKEEYKVGMTYAWGSFILLLFLIFFLRKLMERFGCSVVLQIAQLVAAPTVVGIPACHIFYGTWFLWPGLMAVTAMWGICMGVMLTGVQIGINSVVQQEMLGSANGMALSIVALIRSLGPLTAGTLFGWSLNNGLGFPFNYYFAYFLEAILLFSSSLIVRCGFKISVK